MTVPKLAPAQLSNEGRTLYATMLERRGDLSFDPLQRQYVRVQPGTPLSPVLTAAIDEVVAANLGEWDAKKSRLTVRAVHEQYTVAEPGSGDQYIEVSVIEGTRDPDRDRGALLACLPGATLEVRSSGSWPVWDIISRHRKATDVEHDTARIAHLQVANPVLVAMRGQRISEFVGTLVSARLYPCGVAAADAADDVFDGGEMCDSCTKSHPFAPYLPPRRRDLEAVLPLVVRFTVEPKKAFPGA